MGLRCLMYLAVLSGFFLLAGMFALATANYDDDFWEHFDRSVDPGVVLGSVLLILGALTGTVTTAICCIGYREYKKYRNTGGTPIPPFTPPHARGHIYDIGGASPSYSGGGGASPGGYTTVPQGPSTVPYTHPHPYAPGMGPYPSPGPPGQYGHQQQAGYGVLPPQYGEQPPPYSPYFSDCSGGYSGAVASFPVQQDPPSPLISVVAQAGPSPPSEIETKGEGGPATAPKQ
ncbi:uncharacterized protein LOC143023092 isoform X2 [Oratosquilla oratoria]